MRIQCEVDVFELIARKLHGLKTLPLVRLHTFPWPPMPPPSGPLGPTLGVDVCESRSGVPLPTPWAPSESAGPWSNRNTATGISLSAESKTCPI
jgi:hypothetical protein